MSCRDRDTIPQGAVDPYHLRINVTNTETEAEDIDLTDVVDAAFDVKRPDGTAVSWPAQIESVSALTIRIAYAFQPTDLDQLGEFQVVPKLITALGGILFGRTRRFTVQPSFKE